MRSHTRQIDPSYVCVSAFKSTFNVRTCQMVVIFIEFKILLIVKFTSFTGIYFTHNDHADIYIFKRRIFFFIFSPLTSQNDPIYFLVFRSHYVHKIRQNHLRVENFTQKND